MLKGVELSVDVSVGISVYPEDGDGVEIMVKNADMAMYAAKESGEGYHFFTGEMNARAMERMQLESSLRRAVHADQFRLLYQPIVDAGGRILGAEALLRWEHPEMGLVRPAQFIPVAEEIGVIVPIGKWVLDHASRQARAWHDKGFPWLYLSVNVSSRQFREPDFVEMVEQVLDESGLAPDSLKLELTESGVMENPEEAISKDEDAPGQRVAFRHRRFRHGVFVPQLFEAVSPGRPEDRSLFRGRRAYQPGRSGDHQDHHRHGPEPGDGDRGRRHRNQGPAGAFVTPGVRFHAGILFWPPHAGRGNWNGA